MLAGAGVLVRDESEGNGRLGSKIPATTGGVAAPRGARRRDVLRGSYFHDTSFTAEVRRPRAISDNIALHQSAENLAPFLYRVGSTQFGLVEIAS
jgi:hypothetical protein